MANSVGSYGFSRQWVNPDSDLFIGAVEETCEAAAACGMDSDKNWAGGFLLKPPFYTSHMTSEEKNQFIREELKMDPDKFILVLGTGRMEPITISTNLNLSTAREFARKLLHFVPEITWYTMLSICGTGVILR